MDKFIVGVQVTVLGMVVVLAILLLLYLAMVIMRRLLDRPEEKPPRRRMRPHPAPEAESLPAQKERKVDPKVIAAITAAVMAASEADARPQSRALQLAPERGQRWKALGRMHQLSVLRRQ